jgi:YesN/AraC family two-component response regulator
MELHRRSNLPVVLFVDDEPAILSALRRTFRHEPYEILTAQSAAEALGRVAELPIDALITDERMPGGTGTELLGEVRKRSPQTWLGMLTGYTEPAVYRAGLAAGALSVLTKPWDDGKLRELLRRIFGSARR